MGKYTQQAQDIVMHRPNGQRHVANTIEEVKQISNPGDRKRNEVKKIASLI